MSFLSDSLQVISATCQTNGHRDKTYRMIPPCASAPLSISVTVCLVLLALELHAIGLVTIPSFPHVSASFPSPSLSTALSRVAPCPIKPNAPFPIHPYFSFFDSDTGLLPKLKRREKRPRFWVLIGGIFEVGGLLGASTVTTLFPVSYVTKTHSVEKGVLWAWRSKLSGRWPLSFAVIHVALDCLSVRP